MSQLHPSRIDVAEDDRAALCELFSVSYAAMSDLRSQVVQARVSVRGSGSHGLNLLCDTVRDGVVEVADGLLARCVVLGGQPRTTIRAMSRPPRCPSTTSRAPRRASTSRRSPTASSSPPPRSATPRRPRHVRQRAIASPPPARASSRDGLPRARLARGERRVLPPTSKAAEQLGDALLGAAFADAGEALAPRARCAQPTLTTTAATGRDRPRLTRGASSTRTRSTPGRMDDGHAPIYYRHGRGAPHAAARGARRRDGRPR